MTLDDFIKIVTILLSLAAIIWQAFTWFKNRSKQKLEEASILTTTAMILVNELQDEINRLKERIEELETQTKSQSKEYLARLQAVEKENHRLKNCIAELEKENTSLRKQIGNGKIM